MKGLAYSPNPTKLCVNYGFENVWIMNTVGRNILKHVSVFEMSLPAKVRRVANSDFQIQENAFGSIPNQITRNADARSPTANETQNGTNAQPGIMDDQVVIELHEAPSRVPVKGKTHLGPEG